MTTNITQDDGFHALSRTEQFPSSRWSYSIRVRAVLDILTVNRYKIGLVFRPSTVDYLEKFISTK